MKKNDTSIARQAGATIVETVFVIAIIVVLSFLVIVSFPTTQQRLMLSRTSYALAQNIKIVQDMALSKNTFLDSFGSEIEPNSYGIYLDLDNQKSSYFIYANLDEDPNFNSVFEIYCDKKINPIEDCILEKKNLDEDENTIFIERVDNTSDSKISINFPVNGESVFISNLLPNYNNVEIILVSKKNLLATKNVSINTVGLIEVK